MTKRGRFFISLIALGILLLVALCAMYAPSMVKAMDEKAEAYFIELDTTGIDR